MLYNERAEIILQQVQLQAVAKIPDLAELLHVSVDTVRRDLKSMEQEGLIKCVRGGACLPESGLALSDFMGREIIHSELKREAAKKAIQEIEPGALIALNSGTTSTILAQELAVRKEKCTVVTNNYAVIPILMQNPEITLIAIGGQVDKTEKSSFGTECEAEFARYYPDIAFLSVNAVNYKDGFTDFRMGELGVLRLLAEHSRKVIAVMDSSKLGTRSKVQVFPVERVDKLISDNTVTEQLKAQYLEKGLVIE